MSSQSSRTARGQRGRISSGLVFGAFALIALFFLVTEHRAHFFSWLPYLLVLACPLLHLLHGHGHHDSSRDHAGTSDEPTGAEPQRPPHAHS
jgi:Protein of unknown function (DUF2933)